MAYTEASKIQIHRMLLLIAEQTGHNQTLPHIQIHRMLLLIVIPMHREAKRKEIQIHRMLLLISPHRKNQKNLLHSNTSYVAINLNCGELLNNASVIQIYRMLLLIKIT